MLLDMLLESTCNRAISHVWLQASPIEGAVMQLKSTSITVCCVYSVDAVAQLLPLLLQALPVLSTSSWTPSRSRGLRRERLL